jgi:hypothetical protein
MESEVHLPSGLTGTIRKVKVKEENILADRKLYRRGLVTDRILGACWLETSDPGPYKFQGDSVDWGAVLQGDRSYALLRLSAFTYGSEYPFRVKCEECDEPIDWEIDLLEDLEVREMTPEVRQQFIEGNKFRGAMPDGTGFSFCMLIGRMERRLPQLRRQSGSELATALLRLRILEVDGVEQKDLRKWISDLDGDVAEEVRDVMLEADIGVETTIEVECQSCGNLQDVDVPFDRLFGKRRKQRRRSLM